MKFSDTKYGDLTGQTYDGNINVSKMRLTSLEGAPKEVKGYFDCCNNKLISLEGGPEIVHSAFNCYFNHLASFKYIPQKIKGVFNCSNNPLTQPEIDKLVRVDIKGKIIVPSSLKVPTPEDRKLYKKLGDKKYFKLKSLKDKL